MFFDRYEQQGNPTDLDAAVEHAQLAFDTAPVESLVKLIRGAELASILITRYDEKASQVTWIWP